MCARGISENHKALSGVPAPARFPRIGEQTGETLRDIELRFRDRLKDQEEPKA